MPNDENKIILEFPATNVEIELGETITFDNISGFLDSGRVTYNGDSLTEEIAHLENDKADETYVNEQVDLKMDKANPTGTGRIAVGQDVVASGAGSQAFGVSSTASGLFSHAEGFVTTASGESSHAEGNQTTASGRFSHAEGNQTIASGRCQHVSGMCNVVDNNNQYVEIIGNGGNSYARSNARTLDWQGNETLAGDLTINGNQSVSGEITRLDGRIDGLPEAMVFKGTLGVNGDIQTLPTASAEIEGWTFKCITAGTYAGLELKVGDTVTCFNPPNTSVYEWDISGYGDTDTDTWRAIKVNGEDALGSGISSGAVDFEDTANVKFEFDANGNKVRAKLDGIYTDSEVDDLLDDKADADNTYTKEQVDDIVYNILPDDTASGSVANFETDLALPIKSLEVDVNAVQDLHGQSGAYPSGGQLWDEQWELGTFDQTTGEKSPSTTLRRNVTPIAVSPSTSYARVKTDSGTLYACRIFYYTSNMELISSEVDTANVITFTTPNNCAFVNIAFQTSIDKISINYPSTDTAYHPYSNICPIGGWSEISLVHCGKNLFDIVNKEDNKGLAWSTGLPFSENKSVVSDYLIVKGGKKYTCNYKAQWCCYDKDKNYLGNILDGVLVYTSGGEVYTNTIPNGVVFLRLGIRTSSNNNEDITEKTDIAFCLGNTATYEPYNGATEVINLGGTYYGGHFTQDKVGHRQFVVTHGYITLDGTQDISVAKWRPFSNTIGWVYPYNLTNNKIVNNNEFPNMKCEELPVCKYGGLYEQDIIGIGTVSSYGLVVRVAEPTLTTKSAINAYLTNNPIHTCYELATPYTIDLPDGEPIATLVGTNNIFADTGDTSVVFKDSVNGYIEKKIANVQALALNS